MRFGGVIIRVITSVPQKDFQTSNLSITNRPRRNTWLLFLLNKLHFITQTLRPEQQ